MKSLRRLGAIFLTVILCVSLFATSIFATETDTTASTDVEGSVADVSVEVEMDVDANESDSMDSDRIVGEIKTLESETQEEGEPQTYEEGNNEEDPAEQDNESTLAQPVLSSLKGGNSGVAVSWKAVSGAEKYQVYRKTSGASWKKLADTKETSYTDTTAKTGTTYYYTVSAFDASGTESNYDDVGLTIKYVKAPTLTEISNKSSGVKVTWKAVSGAGQYSVYRKKSGGSWTKIGTTTSTSYTDKTASSGKKYFYTVRCMNADGSMTISGYDKKGISITYLAAPKLKSATASASGTKISWGKVSGAKGYAVFRKTSNGKWKRIGTTTSTSYTDKSSRTNGKTYYYTVRAYRGSKSSALNHKYSSTYWGSYDSSGLKMVYTKAPTIKSVSSESSGVKVKWESVSGAKGYAVYRKTSGGSWSQIATTTSTSYTDTTASSSKTYSYAVRAYRGDQSTALANTYNAMYWSGYNTQATSDAAMVKKAQGYSSSTKWMILVNTKTNKLGVFYGSKGNWTLKYYWDCSTGKASTPTKKGSFTVGSKGKYFNGDSYTCWYYTQFSGNYLFHSVLYEKGSMTKIKDGRLGKNLSHGCVRLDINNAKWIYDNIPHNTKVVTY